MGMEGRETRSMLSFPETTRVASFFYLPFLGRWREHFAYALVPSYVKGNSDLFFFKTFKLVMLGMIQVLVFPNILEVGQVSNFVQQVLFIY